MDNIITIGITGGIGSGKSYICRILETMGYPVFYSDEEAKKILSTNDSVISEIKELFGAKAYLNNKLNAPFLASNIFEDSTLRRQMNSIIHPKVRQAFLDFIKTSDNQIVFNEAAILFETDSYKKFDYTILVTAPYELKIKRIQKRDQLSVEKIKSRMNSQWSDKKKLLLADFVVNNDQIESLQAQIESVLKRIQT